MRRASLVMVFAAGCNQIYGLDATTVADPNNPFDAEDYDLDGHGNSDDNCPSIANEAQTDGDDDGVGDVCDQHPRDATDRIVERTFFADPAFDRERWFTSNFTFEPRAVVSDPAELGATIRTKRSYEDRFVAVELGFEAVVWNTNQFNGGVRIELDDIDGPSGLLRKGEGYMSLQAGPAPDAMNSDFIEPEIGVDIPIRMVLAYDRETTRNEVRVGAAWSAIDVPPLPPGPVSIAVIESAARLRYVVIYGRR